MRLRYFHREIKVATSSYDSGAQPWRVGNAWIGSNENPIFPTIRSTPGVGESGAHCESWPQERGDLVHIWSWRGPVGVADW